MSLQYDGAVQAGTPMTAIGEVSLLPWLEAGRLFRQFIYSKISRGALIGLPIEAGQSPCDLCIVGRSV